MHAPRTTISPLLCVRNGARAVQYYQSAFGAEQLFRIDSESGEVIAQRTSWRAATLGSCAGVWCGGRIAHSPFVASISCE
jgi:uncharacterized glyoxalase superfamily protein PhnB